jgi:hypothetical protein
MFQIEKGLTMGSRIILKRARSLALRVFAAISLALAQEETATGGGKGRLI